ncbi:MAG TPA: polymer-forming cytoskeletal protein [Alphaproteobacteria bacterium]|nr:polymer-forming cytoskeletal protein [Alphaproteobacteria bacterium]
MPSIISADMRVSGDLRTEGDVQVDGVVDGDIQAATLSIGKSAEVNGEVAAETIRVWGKVNGRVRGRDVALMETAKVQGDILHDTLEVARGAQVEGTVKRQAPDEPKQAKVNLVVTGGEATAGGSGRAS